MEGGDLNFWTPFWGPLRPPPPLMGGGTPGTLWVHVLKRTPGGCWWPTQSPAPSKQLVPYLIASFIDASVYLFPAMRGTQPLTAVFPQVGRRADDAARGLSAGHRAPMQKNHHCRHGLGGALREPKHYIFPPRNKPMARTWHCGPQKFPR